MTVVIADVICGVRTTDHFCIERFDTDYSHAHRCRCGIPFSAYGVFNFAGATETACQPIKHISVTRIGKGTNGPLFGNGANLSLRCYLALVPEPKNPFTINTPY